MINRHQISNLKSLPKYNGKSVCNCNQKCHFATNKCVMTMKCTRDIIINAMKLENDKKTIATHKMTQYETWRPITCHMWQLSRFQNLHVVDFWSVL